jgi:hypothetical protein
MPKVDGIVSSSRTRERKQIANTRFAPFDLWHASRCKNRARWRFRWPSGRKDKKDVDAKLAELGIDCKSEPKRRSGTASPAI